MKKVTYITFLVILSLSIIGCNQLSEPKYEYKTIGLECSLLTHDEKVLGCYDSQKVIEYFYDVPIIDYPTYESFLNEYGKEGWRVIDVNIYSSMFADHTRIITFERIK